MEKGLTREQKELLKLFKVQGEFNHITTTKIINLQKNFNKNLDQQLDLIKTIRVIAKRLVKLEKAK